MPLILKFGIGVLIIFSNRYIQEPNTKILSNYYSGVSNPQYKDKFGGVEANRKILVANDEINKEWWNWIYINRLVPIRNKFGVHEEFKKATSGYKKEASSTNSLNMVCANLYKKSRSEIETGKTNLKTEIARFCCRNPQAKLESPRN